MSNFKLRSEMPSEMMKHHGLSPSFFHEDAYFSDERQVGPWKIDHMSGYYGLKANGALRMTDVASTALENGIPLDNQMKTGLDLPEYYLSGGRNVNLSLASRSLPTAADHDLGGARPANMNNKESASYFLNGDRIINLMGGAQYENGLFSSSLSHQFSRKLKLPSADAVYGQSVGDAAAPYEEEEVFESLKDIEAQTIGNLLPDDDDELFSGVNEGGFNNNAMRPNNKGEDMEDVDLFSSVGGLELGEDGSSELSDVNSNSQLRGVSACGENPSRTLFVRNINSNIDDSDLQKLFEQYGEIHTLYTACKHRGFVMVSYFDIRASCNAMSALQEKPLMRRKLDIHFSIPKENSSEKDINQGAIMVFNHDASVSNDELREVLGVYGEIKEVLETPQSSRHKFVEFYDVRAADSALHALKNSRADIVSGKPITLEAVRPGGSKRLMQHISSSELDQEESGVRLLQHSPNLTTGYLGSLSLGVGTKPNAGNGTIVDPRTVNRGPTPLLDNNNNNMHHHHHGGVSSASSVPNGLSSLLVRRAESGNRSSIVAAESADRLQYHLKFDHQGKSSLHPRSLPDYYDGLTNGTSFGSPSTTIAAANITSARPAEIKDNQHYPRFSSNGQSMEFNEVFGSSSGNESCPPPGHHYIWGNSHRHHRQSQAPLWPNSPSFVVDGICVAHTQQLHAVHRPSPHMLSSLLPLNNHHVGSAPSINPCVWDRQHAYAGGSPDPVVFHPGSLGNTMISGNSHAHPLEYLHHNAFPPSVGNCVEMSIPSKSIGLQPHHQRSVIFPARGGQLIPMMMSSFDSPPNERTRNRSRSEFTATYPDNKKQFELDVDRIMRGDDKRTTLMIKNIPNKYTSKMLLAAIDERHKGTYDFIYLPIDFKNKCNVGYAFINMTDPSLIVPFYQTFNGKKWEKFNSEKVATLAYGRIQGKTALIAHFQNSSLMNEDKRCRPILFHTDGPKAGDQVPFPMGTSMRQRAGKIRAGNEENNQETPPNPVNKEDYSNGDYSSSGSVKESD